MVVVLGACELAGDVALVVVVDESDSADDFVVFFPFVLYERVSY